MDQPLLLPEFPGFLRPLRRSSILRRRRLALEFPATEIQSRLYPARRQYRFLRFRWKTGQRVTLWSRFEFLPAAQAAESFLPEEVEALMDADTYQGQLEQN